MSKSVKRRSSAKLTSSAKVAKPLAQIAAGRENANSNRSSKQSRVVAMLQSSSGATVAAMMKATGWQKHSVRGFLAGVVRKRLQLKLESSKMGDDRIYRIAGKNDNKPNSEDAKRQAA